MKTKQKTKRSDKRKGDKHQGLSGEDLAAYLDVKRKKAPEGYIEVESYPLKPPFSYAFITQNEDTAEFLYIVDELPLTQEEKEAYAKMKNILENELRAPEEEESLIQAFHRQLPEIMANHRKILREISPIGTKKITYYLERDIAGFAKIDSLMFDPHVEDISCSGVNKPIFLWHRNYENIKTNVYFRNDEELEDFAMKIVHKAGKHVSIAFPIVDVTLPDKHRLAVSYGREVTPAGTSFTIRKFRKDPFTVIDLIKNETINESIAAYLWLLMEHKMSLIIIGATGAGKTTSLNAIACLIRPTHKIISVEEVAEINLPHENWVSTISRSGFGIENEGEIPLFGLIKSAVRHRPDLIIVGEIRGDEAYVLFQALATGHGGLCTLHAEKVETAVKRLTQPPMNIPPGIISLMNCAIVVKHVRPPIFDQTGTRLSSRKFIQVSEIKNASTIRGIFTWDPSSDTFQEELSKSFLLKDIAKNLNVSHERLMRELEHRRKVLLWLTERNIRDYRSLHNYLSKYYRSSPSEYEKLSEKLSR
ncbi:MAG: type II/IV secretion system ATPase subunit [Candidatus Bathyarchaeota archaeon]|nr:MAG: type II/IV secretion system ATPase subunit [Candidatus Bathyarchaeota archaeon]